MGVPVGPLRRGQLDVAEGLPGPLRFDEFGLLQADCRFQQGVVEDVADGALDLFGGQVGGEAGRHGLPGRSRGSITPWSWKPRLFRSPWPTNLAERHEPDAWRLRPPSCLFFCGFFDGRLYNPRHAMIHITRRPQLPPVVALFVRLINIYTRDFIAHHQGDEKEQL
ncbi:MULTISPECIES: hypothetical protein [unclassified Streptomyces]|uniref:hypothetical protein n=1 Tax=unclassified Streptomyces TaxID=2593676 RepID=UPI0033AF73CD